MESVNATMDAVVLAGGPPDDVAEQQLGAPNKAFVDIAGQTLIERVVRALRNAPSIGRIVVVAPQNAWERPGAADADERRSDGVRITDSLRNGLAGFPPDAIVLVVASDLPVLTREAIDDFVRSARELDADVAYGCVEKNVHLQRFPEVPHTWARLRDGTYCGGGMVAIKPRALPNLERFIERLGKARKHPIRLASLFGFDMLVKFATGSLTIAEAERRGSDLLGAPVRALVSAFPETGVNVDRVSDVDLARRLVERNDASRPA
jgi:molybdopterin-guanine dinucleotide biosynthesis protein A